MARIHDMWRLWLRQNWWMTAAIVALLVVGVLLLMDRLSFLSVNLWRAA